jgi:hypothetical protein
MAYEYEAAALVIRCQSFVRWCHSYPSSIATAFAAGEAHRYSNVGGQGRVGSVLRLTALTLLYVNKRFSMRKRQSILRDGAMTLAVMLIITAILIGLCIWYGPSSG